MPTEEQKTQKAILDFLKSRDFFARRNYTGPVKHKYGMTPNPGKGGPDIIGWVPCGKAIQIEVKDNEKSKRSPEQIEWIKRAKADNVIAMFAWDIYPVITAFRFCGERCRIEPRCDCPWKS